MVIDLGCHAGGWSQIILERINREGFVVGVATGSARRILLLCAHTHTHTPFCSFNNLLHLCFSMSILFFALWLWCIWLLKCTSLPFFRSSLVNLSAEAPQDKVLIEPLENHHFVQGDIQHAATIRNKAAQLSAFGQCPQGTVLDLTVLSRMLQKTTSSTKEEQHRTTKCYSEEKTRLEAIATRSKDATRGSWPYY